MPQPTSISSSSAPYSVDQLATEIKRLLEMSYADIWVEGEITQLSTPRSGHSYFTLTDRNSVLKCVLFKNAKYRATVLPAEGARILIRGKISMYTARGDVQMICSYIEAAGEGALRRQFEMLKQQLRSEGLFDQSRKQSLPTAPSEIALITSPSGAVLHDIITTLQRRYPFVRLRVYPANVQGERAHQEILDALQFAIKDKPDVLILARGGGSLEDLQVFNDESVARALANCPIPTVSAIGHETDFVITDFIADMRAPTPTAAAALVTPDISESRTAIKQAVSSLNYLIRQRLDETQQNLDYAIRGLKHPRQRLQIQNSDLQHLRLTMNAAFLRNIQTQRRDFDRCQLALLGLAPQRQIENSQYQLQTLKERLEQLIQQRLNRGQASVEQTVGRLNALSPLKTLGRGYAILHTASGEVIQNSDQVANGEIIQARLLHGKLGAVVTSRD